MGSLCLFISVIIVDLCLVSTISAAGSISHQLVSRHLIDEKMSDLILGGPYQVSFSQSFYVALRSEDFVLDKNIIKDDLELAWVISIVDDLEGKPLLDNISNRRSILLMGEMLFGIAEGLSIVGFSLNSLEPNAKINSLSINYVIPKGLSLATTIGSTICLVNMIDSLLFARGLSLANPRIVASKHFTKLPSAFWQLNTDILTKSYEY